MVTIIVIVNYIRWATVFLFHHLYSYSLISIWYFMFLSSRLIINTPSCSNLFPSYYFLQSFLLITSSFTTPPFSLNRLLLLLLSVINSVINVYHFIYSYLLFLSLMFIISFIYTSYSCHSYLRFSFHIRKWAARTHSGKWYLY